MGKKENQHRWYVKHKAAHQTRVHQYRREKSAENKAKVNQYFGDHPCVDCGETDLDMLTFDHVRGRKRTEVSVLVSQGYKWEAIQEEIDKCVVRCWNHHMKRTAERRRDGRITQ